MKLPDEEEKWMANDIQATGQLHIEAWDCTHKCWIKICQSIYMRPKAIKK